MNGNLDGLGRNPQRIQMYLYYIYANCMILAGLASVTMCTGGDVNKNGVDGLVGCNFFRGIRKIY